MNFFISGIQFPSQQNFFVGRNEELQNLEKIFKKDGLCILTAKKGILCKIGKTALAHQYAAGQKEKTTIWIDARKQETLNEGYQKLSEQFSCTVEKINDFLSKSSYLVVFDGVKRKEILKDLPQGNCHVLITSRIKDWEGRKIEMGTFSIQDAVEFLCQYTGKKDTKTAEQIAQELDFLPTSLEKAAQLIIQHKAELDDYFGLREYLLQSYGETLKKIGNLPERNKNFVGRELSLVALEEAFKTDSCVVISSKKKIGITTGLGGIGKTQMALQYAYRNADKYPKLVYWINAESQATIISSYMQLATWLSIRLTDEEKKQEKALFKKINAELERTGGYLLIIDDAKDQASLKGLLPQKGGHLLITSRSPDWDLQGGHIFKVGLFEKRESIALIQKFTSLDHEEAAILAELTHHLPIAVAQAAAYIGQTEITVEEYCKLFKEKILKLLVNQQSTDAHSKTVDATWEISMEEISRREKKKAEDLKTPYPVAGPLMELCSFLASRDIPVSFLVEWLKKIHENKEDTSIANVECTLSLLRDFSMIDWQEKGISVHPLVQLVIKNRLPIQDQQKVCNDALNLIYDPITFDLLQPEKIEANANLVPHAQTIAAYSNEFQLYPEMVVSVFMQIGHFQLLQGHYLEARQTWEKGLELSTAYLGEGHFMSGSLVLNLGLVARNLGDFTVAEEFYRKSIDIFKNFKEPISTVSGEYFSYEMDARIYLGSVLKAQKKHKEALKEYSAVLEHYQKHYPENHRHFSKLYNNIGTVYMEMGQFPDALINLQKALKINKEHYSSLYMMYGEINYNLGLVFMGLDRYHEARDHFLEALKKYDKPLLSDDPHTIPVHYHLGKVYENLEEYQLAKEQYEKAFKTYEKLYGEDLVSLVEKKEEFAFFLGKHKQFKEEAKEQLLEILAIYQKNFPEVISKIIQIKRMLGLMCFWLEQYNEVKIYFDDILSNSKEEHPEIYFSTLQVLKQFVMLLHQEAFEEHQKDSDKAIQKCEYAIYLSDKITDKKLLLSIYLDLRSFYLLKGDKDKCEIILKKAGELNPSSAIFCELGQLLYSRKQYEEAIANLLKSTHYDDEELLYVDLSLVNQFIKEKISVEAKSEVTSCILAYKLLINIYFILGRIEEANSTLEKFRDAVKTKPSPINLSLYKSSEQFLKLAVQMSNLFKDVFKK